MKLSAYAAPALCPENSPLNNAGRSRSPSPVRNHDHNSCANLKTGRSKTIARQLEISAVRRLAAVLAADVAGYSRLMSRNEEGTLERLMAHRRAVVDPKISEHHGRIVKTTGDGMLAEFASVVDAVRCAVEMQRGMAERNLGVPISERLDFRVGINLTDVIVAGDDIYGDGVNVAARVEA